jgi:hypothetical protein
MLPPIYRLLKDHSPVATIVATRIFRHGNAPQDTARPYVTWFMVSGVPENQLSGLPGHDRCTVQVDCWHQTDNGVQDLAEAVREAMEADAHMTGVIANEREAATKLYRIGLQFDYWLPRTEPQSD